MKVKLNSWINALLATILGLLGYGCSREEYLCMYGVPTADLVVEGTVSNEDNEPLQNIQVVHRAGWKDGEGAIYWREIEQQDTLYTNAEGKFARLYSDDFPLEYRKIIVNDTTGVYASDSIDTSVSYSGGDGHWYHGQGKLAADFVLKKK